MQSVLRANQRFDFTPVEPYERFRYLTKSVPSITVFSAEGINKTGLRQPEDSNRMVKT